MERLSRFLSETDDLVPKSIVVIAHNCKDGGSVGSVAWHQIIELSKVFAVYVITRDIPVVENENIFPMLISPKLWTFLRRFCHLPNELTFQRAARSALDDLCKKVDIGTVWCHSHGTVVLGAFPLKKKYGFKIVMTTHGDIFQRPKGTYNQVLTSYYKWATPRAYKNSDRIQALSPYMAECAKRNGAQEDKVTIIPNGIDSQDIGVSKVSAREAETFLRNGALSVLFVGNLVPIKGVDVLIRAIADLKSLGKQCLRVICIGDGPEKSNLLALCKQLEVENEIEFVGKVPKEHLHKFYRQADVLCVPSRSDPLPTVVLEAFAMGLPVVGANTGGIPYMLNNGERGFLFEPGNIKSLADALASAARSAEKLEEISKEYHAAAENEFSWRLIGQHLCELIDRETEGQR